MIIRSSSCGSDVTKSSTSNTKRSWDLLKNGQLSQIDLNTTNLAINRRIIGVYFNSLILLESSFLALSIDVKW